MKRQEFINYAIAKHPLNRNIQQVGFEPYNRYELEAEIRSEYTEQYNINSVLNFFEGVGTIYFQRTEQESGDILTIDIRWLAYVSFWKDINSVVNRIGYIKNCAGVIETLYLSENGKFYADNHMLIAENEELFFDYLTTVEFDFHPVIAQRTYEMLSFFGWYEGRQVNTSDFECEMRRRGIYLTQKQLDFISEFSGLSFAFDDCYYNWWFYSLDEMLQDNSSQLRTGYEEVMHYQGETVALKALICGDRIDTRCPLYVDEDVKWLSIDHSPKME